MTIIFRRIVSFARKRTHNRAKEQQILQELLPSLAVQPNHFADLAEIFSPKKYQAYTLEIGFGSGENILQAATLNPNTGYIGCEVFTGGVTRLIEDMQRQEIDNIRIWYNDALELIPNLPDNSLSLVYILYPDPWPKKRHNKRRLINEEFLALLTTKIAAKGILLMVTDHQDYAEHITSVIRSLENSYSRISTDYPAVTKTKYRLKAEAQGIDSHYFCLEKLG